MYKQPENENKEGKKVVSIMYKVVKVSGFMREAIDKKGKPNKYREPKLFTLKEAENFVKKNSYTGMSFKYEIVEL